MEHEERLKAALADRYRIDREIGSGGMATVYLAEDLKHDRDVALKVLNPELAETLGAERFLREIKTAAHLTHPHILPVFDSGEADGFLYYVMPFVEGESLRARLTKEKQLPVEDAIQITREIADALAYAHEKGVIHRDVKPANIMLEAGHAVLADFGVAHAVAEARDERITRTGTSLGTPAYMSPEQASGERELDGRSDQYALACVLFEMLSGQPPFTGAQVEAVVRQHLTAKPPDLTQLRPSVSCGVGEVIEKALSKAPADRFSSVTEFGNVLANLSNLPTGGTAPPARLARRHPWGLAMAGVGALAVAGVLFWRGGSDEPAGRPAAPPPWAILVEVEGSAPGDLREIVGDLLSVDLSNSDLAEVVDTADVRIGMVKAGMPDTARLTVPVAMEMAERGRIRTVFVPKLDRVGETYILTVQAHDVVGDSLLATKRVTAGDDEGLIGATRAVADSLRPALAAASGERIRRPLTNPQVTTSLAALRKYRETEGPFVDGRYEEVITLTRDVLSLDSAFALAWWRLGYAYNNVGIPDSAASAWREALKYPEGLGEATRMGLEARVSPDPLAHFKLVDRRYRETGEPTNTYAVRLADDLGRYEEALAIYQELEGWSPFGVTATARWSWAGYLLAMGRVVEARTVAAGLEGTPWELPMRAKIALMVGSWREAERLASEMVRDPTRNRRWRSDAFRTLASARAAQGRLEEADAALQQMIALNRRLGRPENPRWSHLNHLLLMRAAGQKPDSSYLEALRTDTTLHTRAVAGLWAVEIGDTALAKSYLEALPVPVLDEFDSPSVQGSLVAALRAGLASARGDWAEAVRVLEPVTGDQAPRRMESTRLPNWIRAEAEEELGRLEAAAELYAQIADGYRFGDYEVPAYGLTYSFAHRRAALLYGQLGDRDKAIEHWRAFLEAFTQPDPDFEWMVEEGRAELARLGG